MKVFSVFCFTSLTLLLQSISAFRPSLPNNSLRRSPITTTIKMTATNKPEDAQVVVVGSANQDLTSYTSTVPVLGQTVMGQTFDTSCGGKGANQAVAAACLGMVPVRMVCRVADDVFGTELLENFSTI